MAQHFPVAYSFSAPQKRYRKLQKDRLTSLLDAQTILHAYDFQVLVEATVLAKSHL
jgi:hypothetical protein